MPRKVTLKDVISVMRLSLVPAWGWPQPRDVTKFKMFCVTLHHCLSIVVMLLLTLPMSYGVKKHSNEPDVQVNQIIIISSLIHSSFNFVFYIINHHHIQNVTFEMVHFSDSMKPHEEVLIQRYLDKCVVFHGASIFIFYFFTLLYLLMPFITDQTFPTMAEYPFDVLQQPLKTIVYIHQSVCAILVTSQLCTNVFMALLLWYTSARFEMLSEQLEKVTNIYEMYKCIKKHQELFKYATEIVLVVRPFVFTSVCCSTISLISIFLLLITKQPILVTLQFSGLSLSCIAEVFMYTWPAEYLISMCHNIAQTAFNILENDSLVNLIKIWKCLQIIIMRSQEPVTISIPCFLPMLSLNYFTSYLSTIFSYFTTLRVMMIE